MILELDLEFKGQCTCLSASSCTGNASVLGCKRYRGEMEMSAIAAEARKWHLEQQTAKAASQTKGTRRV
jgi:hypothetical protein